MGAWRDFRHAARLLRRNPSFTTIAVLTLALGVGGSTSIFSLVDSVLLRPLPYSDPGQLVSIKDDLRGLNLQDVGMSQPEFEDLRDRSGMFAGISVAWPISANLTGGDRPERVEALAVSPSYFTMLGAAPQIGRIFGAQDRTDGFAEAAILSDGLWRRLYGASRWALGKQIRLDNDLYTIVGVMPPAFRHPGRTVQSAVDVWITAGFRAEPFPNPPVRAVRMLPGAIGRLRPGLAPAQAQQQEEAFATALRAEYPKEYPAKAGWIPRITPLQADLTGNVRNTLLVVFGAVVCVLLICCVSIANLMVAKAIGRQREMAVRRAMGAPWNDLVRQFLAESLTIAAIGGGVGWALAVFLAPVLPRLVPMELPVSEIAVNGPVLWFALASTVLTGAVFGLAPVLPMMQMSIVGSLRDGSRGSTMGSAHSRLRAVLVVSEVAFSMILMFAAGLLLHSFWNLTRLDPGFEPKRAVVANLWLPRPNDTAQFKYGNAAVRRAFMREVLRRARTIPGVEAAAFGIGSSTPMMGFNKGQFLPEGSNAPPGERPIAQNTSVTPEFFRALGIRLLEGRVFTETDEGENLVAVVDETLARRIWPGQSAVGKRIGFGAAPQWATIVGVVGTIKSAGLEAPDAPHLYISAYQRSGIAMTVFVRTAGGAAGTVEALRREVQAVDPDLPVFGARTMEEVVAQSFAQRRFQLQMIGAFAGVALLLAALGIYGVTAYWVSQRTQEIGIRIALGAGGGTVIRMVLRQGMLLTAWGIAVGIACALPFGRLLRSLLFGAEFFDPATFAGVAALLAATALAACYLPARRATRVDPMRALRSE
jgi:putative ABC transport system permease protein